jgi:hypothetical protein
MKTSLTAGLSAQEKNELERDFHASAHLRNRIIDVLKDKAESNRRDTRSKDRYVEASWAYLQADSIGYERALFEVISLLSSKTP